MDTSEMDDTRGTELLLQLLPEIQEINELPLTPPGVESADPPHRPGPSTPRRGMQRRSLVQMAQRLEGQYEMKRRAQRKRSYATAMSVAVTRKLRQFLAKVDEATEEEREADRQIALSLERCRK